MTNVNYLSLFSGIGGGDLASQHLLGWNCIGYVEWDKYCCDVLLQRIKDGVLSDAPVFCIDIREWNRIYAPMYTGLVDIITGGFPCQPFSVAGKQLAENDERNMWPATIECIRTIRPEFCFLENVSGILSRGYIRTIFGELAESGYNARWRVLSAAEVGAPHKRDRLWIVAYNTDSSIQRFKRKENKNKKTQIEFRRFYSSNDGVEFFSNDEIKSSFLGKDDVVPHYVDRVKAIGNGQVPLVAATAWGLLTEDLFDK